MVSALYDDPLSPIDTGRIEGWLVETDYPLDATAINAALRGLEYREIVRSTAKGLAITAGMMQTWLLEHARLDETPADMLETRPFAADWRLLIVGAVVVVIVLLVAASLGGNRPSEASGTPLPTVTLAGGG
jgi:hypothetical protein